MIAIKTEIRQPRKMATRKGGPALSLFPRSVDGAATGSRADLGAVAAAFAVVVGETIRRRVRDRAQPVDPPTKMGGRGKRRGPAYVNPAYPASKSPDHAASNGTHVYAPHGTETGWERFYRQAGARKGSFHVSGGGWEGLTVVAGLGTPTRGAATVLFRGRSQGSEPAWSTAGQKKRIASAAEAATTGNVAAARRLARMQATSARRLGRGRQITNALKMYTGFSRRGVNVLRMTPAEEAALGEAVFSILAGNVERVMGGGFAFRTSPWSNPTMTAQLIAAAEQHLRNLRS